MSEEERLREALWDIPFKAGFRDGQLEMLRYAMDEASAYLKSLSPKDHAGTLAANGMSILLDKITAKMKESFPLENGKDASQG